MLESDLPLKGVRVLDLGIITAGAATSALLADLGADVIKIEAPNYIDPFRIWVDIAKVDDWWNASPYFNFTNRNKRSLCLDLKQPAGRDIFLRLVAVSDVLVENFRRGVMHRLELGPEALHAANSALVFASISSQGETGPERGVSSFGSTLEATSGMAYLAGEPGGPPVLSGRDLNYPDQVVALFAAGIIVAALRARQKSGAGAHLDISQRELTSFLLGEKFLSGSTGAGREGNADLCMAQQTIARATDGTWIAMSKADGPNPGAAGDTRDKLALCDEICAMPADIALEHLRKEGFAASAILDGHAILQASWFGHSIAFADGPDGRRTKGFPFQFRDSPLQVSRPTPKLGEDSTAVLRDLLDIGPDEIAALEKRGVIGNAPSALPGS